MGVLTLVHILISFAACTEALRRADFPQGFVFGTASSAYQYEGAVDEGQRGPTIWDTLTRRPGRVIDFSNADVAVDHYHRYKAASRWLHIVPWGMFNLMKHIKEKYGNPPVIVTENGMDDSNSPFSRLENVLQDDKRIRYHSDYMSNLLDAIRKEGCNVHGYFVWSLLDNWEWNSGYTVRFGLYYVDYNNNLTRIPKASVKWFSQFLAQKTAII
nr:unnamed protein product [Digitaria exilis]